MGEADALLSSQAEAALQVGALLLLLLANVGGTLLVFWDKRQARRRRRRIRERHLIMLSFLGGWPLMGPALVLARHKVRKPRFLLPFCVAAVPSALVFLTLTFGE